MTVRIAVIGAGIMGADHARIVAEDLPGATLQVICDPSVERAGRVADACGALHTATDARAVVDRADVDAVIIASPDSTHATLSLACIGARKPVLCEKPLSQSSRECLEVIAAEIAAGRRLVQLGFMRRFDQSYVEMKAALATGVLGRALMMHNFHRNMENPAADFTAAMAITNSAPHEFDVARFVLGIDFTAISAFQPKRSDALVAPVFMVLETDDGQLVNIEINNNAAYGYDVRGELVGEKGSIALNTPSHSRLDLPLAQIIAHAPDWRPRYGEAYRRQNRAFLTFVQTGEFPASAADCWDGYAAAIVAETGMRALSRGCRTTVEMAERPSFYRKEHFT
ncbi:myo-inositol 2-dehydrogenase / D-chiro-inositol 1-dehydrogenase [Paracoccus alcaliphilus]|uniref:Myo-inositol 2-dehydrogenase / D-chiro-inositol 1-dehydrogenase n=1 Tax=Paracoccus alcaliphilus TaxID=34002 RepID=A0A1H8N7E9_9RHOB|nr:Gfo/Idh/MocA family oxidoreductase [Paracoccus alcaliphilus]WCR18631.1 Gfo/Idh/MocA family oxidoreductase [Paracoccus alcaliphilus]SEO25363.1 myo-inositol 2-dehydrogenase / D-chiro-inositol 1-dehydrogenase [Paracoccus alcaliphilus]